MYKLSTITKESDEIVTSNSRNIHSCLIVPLLTLKWCNSNDSKHKELCQVLLKSLMTLGILMILPGMSMFTSAPQRPGYLIRFHIHPEQERSTIAHAPSADSCFGHLEKCVISQSFSLTLTVTSSKSFFLSFIRKSFGLVITISHTWMVTGAATEDKARVSLL